MGAAEPWWASDPTIQALSRAALEEIEGASAPSQEADEPDPVLFDVLSGASWRELAEARDDLDRASLRYAAAVRAARVVGHSWGDIGRVVGVSKQALHRRFGDAR